MVVLLLPLGYLMNDSTVRDESLSNEQSMNGQAAYATSPRVLLLGMAGTFSLPLLVALLDAGVDVAALVMPSPRGPDAPPVIKYEPSASERRSLPMAGAFTERTIAQIAWEQYVPVVE